MRAFLFLNFLFLTSVQAADWNRELHRQVAPHWIGGKVDVRILQVPPLIPAHAFIRLTGADVPLGLVPFEWSWMEGSTQIRKYGTANVQVKMKVAVAKGPLTNGQPVDLSLIDFKEHELSPLYQMGFFTKPEELNRRKIRGYVPPGAVLGARNTTAPLLVERGQTVTLNQITGVLKLGAQMESLESGSIGEWVRVSHPKTHKVIRARISGPGYVELN